MSVRTGGLCLDGECRSDFGSALPVRAVICIIGRLAHHFFKEADFVGVQIWLGLAADDGAGGRAFLRDHAPFKTGAHRKTFRAEGHPVKP